MSASLIFFICFFTQTFAQFPYVASGWRPAGPAFELPILQSNQQREQTFRENDYTFLSDLSRRLPNYRTIQNQLPEQKNELNQNNLRILQNNLQQYNLKSQQQLPYPKISQSFQPSPASPGSGLSLNGFSLSETSNQYLPTTDFNIGVRRDSQPIRTSQEAFQENFNSEKDLENSKDKNFRTELLPNFPAYNPNITHVEDTGNLGNLKQPEITTVKPNDIDDRNFGRRLIVRKTLVRRNKRPIKTEEVRNNRNIVAAKNLGSQ